MISAAKSRRSQAAISKLDCGLIKALVKPQTCSVIRNPHSAIRNDYSRGPDDQSKRARVSQDSVETVGRGVDGRAELRRGRTRRGIGRRRGEGGDGRAELRRGR